MIFLSSKLTVAVKMSSHAFRRIRRTFPPVELRSTLRMVVVPKKKEKKNDAFVAFLGSTKWIYARMYAPRATTNINEWSSFDLSERAVFGCLPP